MVYQAVPVERRDISVSALASGTIQPDTTVEVKSKASGEILQLLAETGQLVKRGDPLVQVDPRNARNLLAQAQADLDVAKAKLTNATTQKNRSDELYKSQSITDQEHEQALLDYADAKSGVVNAQVSVDNAKIQLEDTDVRAPDHRHGHRKGRRARRRHRLRHQQRERRHDPAQDGRPEPRAGQHAGGRDRHRQDPGRICRPPSPSTRIPTGRSRAPCSRSSRRR